MKTKLFVSIFLAVLSLSFIIKNNGTQNLLEINSMESNSNITDDF